MAHGEQQGEQADRHVDVEHGPPHEGFRQPAAEGWPEHGRHHDAEAENGERLSGLFAREGVEQDGLAQGDERRADQALRQPEHHHAFQAPRQPAKRRGDDEAQNRDDEETPPPEPCREVAGERHHHGRGDEVRREHPGDLIRGGAEAAQHMRDGHAHDGDVEDLKKGGEHDRHDQRDRRLLRWRRGRRRGALRRFRRTRLGATEIAPAHLSS